MGHDHRYDCGVGCDVDCRGRPAITCDAAAGVDLGRWLISRMHRQRENGAAVVDFVLVMVLLIPIVLGVIQVGLVLHVRNVLTAAASEGARAAAAQNAGAGGGTARAKSLIATSLRDSYADKIMVRYGAVEGFPGVTVRIKAKVPALGIFGPSTNIEVTGHAIREQLP